MNTKRETTDAVSKKKVSEALAVLLEILEQINLEHPGYRLDTEDEGAGVELERAVRNMARNAARADFFKTVVEECGKDKKVEVELTTEILKPYVGGEITVHEPDKQLCWHGNIAEIAVVNGEVHIKFVWCVRNNKEVTGYIHYDLPGYDGRLIILSDFSSITCRDGLELKLCDSDGRRVTQYLHTPDGYKIDTSKVIGGVPGLTHARQGLALSD